MMSTFLQRMVNPETPAAQPDLPFPRPTNLIEGPRIPLRYGSAATEISIDTLEWRRTDCGDRFTYQGRWRSIHDYRESDCCVGKLVRLKRSGHIGVCYEDDEGFLSIASRSGVQTGFTYRVEDIDVLDDPAYLNMFERAIAAHLEKQS